MPAPLYEFGGSGPVLHLAIGNGFPPETYRPFIVPLTAHYRVVSLPPRPLWHGPPDPGEFTSWRVMADDLHEGLRVHNLQDVILVGHSMGGVASMLVTIAEPRRVRALAFLDPTLLPPLALAGIALLRLLGRSEHFPLVQGALKRRNTFPSEEAAFEYWREKSLFAGWPDETMRLYAQSMTRPAAGGGVRLRWTRRWEAQIYKTVITNPWREVPKLRSLLPVLVVRGAETNTFRPVSMRKMQRLLPGATYETIEGHGHLFPHSAPHRARAVLEGWLEEIDPHSV